MRAFRPEACPVQAKFAVVEESKLGGGAFGDAPEDSGATRVRLAIPKFVLRGVSGAVFSKAVLNATDFAGALRIEAPFKSRDHRFGHC